MNLELGKTCRTCLKNDGVEPLESLHLENQSKTGVIEFFTRLTNLEVRFFKLLNSPFYKKMSFV